MKADNHPIFEVLDKNDVAAFLIYSAQMKDGNSVYSAMNAALRAKDRSGALPFTPLIWSLLQGMKKRGPFPGS